MLDIDARLCDPCVRIRLRLELRIGDRKRESDIQFRVRDLDAQIRVQLQHIGQSRDIRCDATATGLCRLAGQMGLQTHPVDLDAIGLDELEDALGAQGFGAAVFEVVVVVEEQGFVVVLCGQLEGDGDVGFADCLVPDGFAVGAVFIECCDLLLSAANHAIASDCRILGPHGADGIMSRGWHTFIDDIPLRAFALVASGYFLDVVLHDGNQRLVVEPALANPSGQLRMPDKRVATQLFLVLVREIDNRVGTCKGKVVAGGLGGLPFHCVFGSDGVEVDR